MMVGDKALRLQLSLSDRPQAILQQILPTKMSLGYYNRFTETLILRLSYGYGLPHGDMKFAFAENTFIADIALGSQNGFLLDLLDDFSK